MPHPIAEAVVAITGAYGGIDKAWAIAFALATAAAGTSAPEQRRTGP